MATKKKETDAADAGTQARKAPAAKAGKKASPHLPAEGFREAVADRPAGDLNMDPREPYPTGSPPEPKEVFHRIHGHYPDADPKT